MKTKKIVIVLILLLIVLIFIISRNNRKYFTEESLKSELCQYYEELKFLVFNGEVQRLYKDKDNHNVETVNINSKGDIQTIYLHYDISGLYSFLHEGDSIYKEYQSYNVLVIRNGETKTFKLDYGCN